MVGAEYISVPLVKLAYIAIIEYDVCIELVLSLDSLEINHFLCPDIPVHIPRWCIFDYLVFWV